MSNMNSKAVCRAIGIAMAASTISIPLSALADGAAAEGVLQEIVVTATRRTENLQNVAIPVTAVSGDQLESRGIVEPQDLNKAVPGLSLSPQGTNTQVYLRGVGTFTVAAYADSAVAFNIDGVFIAFPSELGGNFFDLERVEVLKGPQGTLYGRNASAGAINLITKRPDFAFGGNASLEIGNYDLSRFSGAINLPLSDKLAARVATQVVRRGGYFSDGTGDNKSESARAQLLYVPTDTFSALVAADYSHSDDHGTPYVPMPSADSKDPWLGPSTAQANRDIVAARTAGVPLLGLPPGIPFPLLDTNQFAKTKVSSVRSEIKWDFGPAALTFIPSYREMEVSSLAEPGFLAYSHADSHEASYEARLSGKTNALDWILGAYYFNSHIITAGDTLQGVAANSFFADEADKSQAAFADATYQLTSRFKLVGGIRYTSEKRTQLGNAQILQFPLPPIIYSYPANKTFNDLSGKAGLNFEVTPESLLYVTASSGFKAGGFNADVAPNSYEPEKLVAYTLGSKNRFLANRLQANFELFYWNYKNHQENVLAPLKVGSFSPQIKNIGRSSLKGVNIDLQYLVTTQDLLSAQFEYLDAKFDSFKFFSPVAPIPGITSTCNVAVLPPAGPGAPPSANVDCSGKPFTRAPKTSALLGYQHTFQLGDGAKIIAALNSQLTSSSYVATDYIPAERQDAYTMTEVSLGYEAKQSRGKWSLFAHVRNIENEAVYSGAFQEPFIPGKTFGTLRAPRTYSLTLNVDF